MNAVAGTSPTLRTFAPLVLGLLRQDPEKRIGLSRVKELLTSLPRQRDASTNADVEVDIDIDIDALASAPVRLPADEQQRLLDDAVRELLTAMTPEDERALWRPCPTTGGCSTR